MQRLEDARPTGRFRAIRTRMLTFVDQVRRLGPGRGRARRFTSILARARVLGMDTRKIARLTGWLMVVTFVTSIPAYFILYAPVRENPGLITGAGADPTASVALGAVLELILIIA